MAKTKGIMNVDLNNPLAVRYMEVALKSWERVSDVFEIEVVQCITPDTLLPDVNNDTSTRSPQELAAFHTHYRVAKRIQNGERLWMMEHDAYFRPEGEEFFRMIMTKWERKNSSFQLGMANEFWTTTPKIAKRFCEEFENGYKRGPMALLHRVTDQENRERKNRHADTYWPANRFKNPEWKNMTGLHVDVSMAYSQPLTLFPSPVVQILDVEYQSTVTDRPKNANPKTPENQPDMLWISLD